MEKRAVSKTIAAALLVIGILVGVTGYYVATTYQTKTITQTMTQQVTTTQTQLSVSTSTVSVAQFTTITTASLTTSTDVVSETITQTSSVISTSTTSVYPVPTNVTVAFVNDNGAYTYDITAGANDLTSTINGGPLAFPLLNLFQGEQINISVSSYGDRSGEVITVELFVNGQMVGQSSTQAGANPAQITYTI